MTCARSNAGTLRQATRLARASGSQRSRDPPRARRHRRTWPEQSARPAQRDRAGGPGAGGRDRFKGRRRTRRCNRTPGPASGRRPRPPVRSPRVDSGGGDPAAAARRPPANESRGAPPTGPAPATSAPARRVTSDRLRPENFGAGGRRNPHPGFRRPPAFAAAVPRFGAGAAGRSGGPEWRGGVDLTFQGRTRPDDFVPLLRRHLCARPGGHVGARRPPRRPRLREGLRLLRHVPARVLRPDHRPPVLHADVHLPAAVQRPQAALLRLRLRPPPAAAPPAGASPRTPAPPRAAGRSAATPAAPPACAAPAAACGVANCGDMGCAPACAAPAACGTACVADTSCAAPCGAGSADGGCCLSGLFGGKSSCLDGCADDGCAAPCEVACDPACAAPCADSGSCLSGLCGDNGCAAPCEGRLRSGLRRPLRHPLRRHVLRRRLRQRRLRQRRLLRPQEGRRPARQAVRREVLLRQGLRRCLRRRLRHRLRLRRRRLRQRPLRHRLRHRPEELPAAAAVPPASATPRICSRAAAASAAAAAAATTRATAPATAPAAAATRARSPS